MTTQAILKRVEEINNFFYAMVRFENDDKEISYSKGYVRSLSYDNLGLIAQKTIDDILNEDKSTETLKDIKRKIDRAYALAQKYEKTEEEQQELKTCMQQLNKIFPEQTLIARVSALSSSAFAKIKSLSGAVIKFPVTLFKNIRSFFDTTKINMFFSGNRELFDSYNKLEQSAAAYDKAKKAFFAQASYLDKIVLDDQGLVSDSQQLHICAEFVNYAELGIKNDEVRKNSYNLDKNDKISGYYKKRVRRIYSNAAEDHTLYIDTMMKKYGPQKGWFWGFTLPKIDRIEALIKADSTKHENPVSIEQAEVEHTEKKTEKSDFDAALEQRKTFFMSLPYRVQNNLRLKRL